MMLAFAPRLAPLENYPRGETAARAKAIRYTDGCARVLSMRFFLNLLWLILCGLWMFLAYLFVGVLWCITIIGIPFGVASFRIGSYALWPFGRTIVKKPGAGVGSGSGNIFWFILSGVWLAIGHAVTGALLCITVIGIPLGLANFKMIPISLFPLGRDIVTA